MDNLWNAVIGKVDGQIRVFGDFENVVYARQTSNAPLPRLSVHATSVGLLAVFKRGRDVDEEEVASRTCLVRDRLTHEPPACLVGRNRRRDDRCASSREFRRDESYPLQVIVALFSGEGVVLRKSQNSEQSGQSEPGLPGARSWRIESPSMRDTLRPPCSLNTVWRARAMVSFPELYRPVRKITNPCFARGG